MINSFLTIVIPCINDVLGLKKTIEDLSKKTKIRGTRVLVLDFGSTDGSVQYISQTASEMLPSLKIEPLKMDENDTIENIMKSIKTEYVLVISTGSIFKDADFILKSVNSVISNSSYPLVYLKPSRNFINDFVSRYINKERRNGAIFSKIEIVSKIEFNHKDNSPNIVISNKPSKIKIGGFTDN